MVASLLTDLVYLIFPFYFMYFMLHVYVYLDFSMRSIDILYSFMFLFFLSLKDNIFVE